ncbi:hypothetical protein ACWGTI_29495 [Mesorhizobium sp. ArgA1]
MIVSFNLEGVQHTGLYRAARLEMLTERVLRQINRIDDQARKLEQAAGALTEANGAGTKVARSS